MKDQGIVGFQVKIGPCSIFGGLFGVSVTANLDSRDLIFALRLCVHTQDANATKALFDRCRPSYEVHLSAIGEFVWKVRWVGGRINWLARRPND